MVMWGLRCVENRMCPSLCSLSSFECRLSCGRVCGRHMSLVLHWLMIRDWWMYLVLFFPVWPNTCSNLKRKAFLSSHLGDSGPSRRWRHGYWRRNVFWCPACFLFLTFFFLPGPQLMGWCHPVPGWVFPPLRTFSQTHTNGGLLGCSKSR